jgi:hypothetical protein
MSFETIPADTTREAWLVQMEIYRRMPGSEKLRRACQMSDWVRKLAASGVRARHPEYTEEQVRLAVIRLSLGDDLFRKAYPGMNVFA